MQDEKKSIKENNEQVVSPSIRNQRMLEHLEKQWQYPHEPSSDILKRITEFVISLPEKYRTAGLTAIADHIANNLILHFLDTMAVFRQKAEQEGISLEEREEYISYILTELFSNIVGINRVLSIQSLDELTTLTAITISLQGLSHTDTAEEAQDWMYELPKIYPSELLQEKLLVNTYDHTKEFSTSTAIRPTHFTDWPSYKQNQGYIASGTGTAQVTELTWTAPTSKPVQYPLETKTPAA